MVRFCLFFIFGQNRHSSGYAFLSIFHFSTKTSFSRQRVFVRFSHLDKKKLFNYYLRSNRFTFANVSSKSSSLNCETAERIACVTLGLRQPLSKNSTGVMPK